MLVSPWTTAGEKVPTLSVMSLRSLRHRRRSATLLIASLAAFVLGTNYCVVAAMGAPRIACHAPIGPTTDDGGYCCQGDGAPAGESGRPAAGFPCCIQVAPPAHVDVAKPALEPTPFALPVATFPLPGSTLAVGNHPDRRTAPPPETLPDLLRGRAPPLS